MIEKMILEEFGRCLLSIIHTANGTKGKEALLQVTCIFTHILAPFNFVLPPSNWSHGNHPETEVPECRGVASFKPGFH